jgi:hypothetical protein
VGFSFAADPARVIRHIKAKTSAVPRQPRRECVLRGLSQTELRGVSCFQYKMKCERSANAEGRLLGMVIISG